MNMFLSSASLNCVCFDFGKAKASHGLRLDYPVQLARMTLMRTLSTTLKAQRTVQPFTIKQK